MKLADFEKATTEELRQTVDALFAGAEEAGFIAQREARWSEARFYIAEIERRGHDRVARRDFWMEVAVIALILIEIILSVYGIRLAIKQGNDADALMTKQTAVLDQLNANMQATAQVLQASQATMQSMNERLGMELGRMARIELLFSFSQVPGRQMTEIYNRGNTDLQFWGYRLGNFPPRIDKKPMLLKGGAKIEHVPNMLSDIHNATTSTAQIEIYVRDDFSNEFVGQGQLPVGPNVTQSGYNNFGGR